MSQKDEVVVWISKTLVATALLLSVGSTLSIYPHQLAYFNEAVGGPENGYGHLLGSNVDWGQDFLLAKRRIVEKGIDLDYVRVVSHGQMSRMANVFLGNSGDVVQSRWQVLSVNRFCQNEDWAEFIAPGGGYRLSPGLWLLRNEQVGVGP